MLVVIGFGFGVARLGLFGVVVDSCVCLLNIFGSSRRRRSRRSRSRSDVNTMVLYWLQQLQQSKPPRSWFKGLSGSINPGLNPKCLRSTEQSSCHAEP